LRILLKRI